MKLLILNLVLAFAWVPICYAITGGKRKNAAYLYLIIMGVQLFVFHAFKDWTTLSDLPMYARQLEFYHSGVAFDPKYIHFEPLYSLIVYCFAQISDTPLLLSIFISGVIIAGYLLTIKRYSAIPWLSVILFICIPFLQSLFVLRQHMAMAICLMTSGAIINRKPLIFFPVVIMASLIHQSALIFLPAYFIYKIDIRSGFWVKFLCVTLVASIVLHGALLWVSSRMGLYSNYLGHSGEDGTNATTMLIDMAILLMAGLLTNVESYRGFAKLSFLMVCTHFLIMMGGIGIPLVTRLGFYYYIYAIFLIPYVLSVKNKADKPYYLFGVLACFIWLFSNSLVKGGYFDRYALAF